MKGILIALSAVLGITAVTIACFGRRKNTCNLENQDEITMSECFKKAFKDMAESAKAQHEVDKANFQAVKA